MPWRRRFAALRLAPRPSSAFGKLSARRIAACAESVALAADRLHDPAGAVRVVERELAEHAGAEHRDVLPALARRGRDRVEVEERADVDALVSLRGGDEQPRPVRRREDRASPRRLSLELARRVAEVEALDVLEAPLAGELRRAFGLGERARVVDLRAAEDALVAGRERLAHRRGRAEDVDDDRRPSQPAARRA